MESQAFEKGNVWLIVHYELGMSGPIRNEPMPAPINTTPKKQGVLRTLITFKSTHKLDRTHISPGFDFKHFQRLMKNYLEYGKLTRNNQKNKVK